MSKRAFTLIELMIVVAIIGILAAIAIPNFVKFQCRSKQSEAKGSLKAIYTAEESYRAEQDKYINCTTTECGVGGTSPIGFNPKGNKVRYHYDVTAVNTTFLSKAIVNATFIGELNTDNWTIDQANTTVNTTNGCL